MAGFYERHDKTTSFYTGIKQGAFEGLYQSLKKSVEVRGRWVFVKNFVKHQKNLPLNPENKAHLSIIRSVVDKGNEFKDLYQDSFGLSFDSIKEMKGASKPLQRGTGIGKGIGQDLRPGSIKRIPCYHCGEVIEEFKIKHHEENCKERIVLS